MPYIDDLISALDREDFAIHYRDDYYPASYLKQLVWELSERIPKNKIIAVIEKNPIQYFCTILAIWKNGSRAVLLDAGMSESEIKSRIQTAKPAAYLLNGTLFNTEFSHDSTVEVGLNVFTSGSTGQPKMVCYSEQPIMNNVLISSKWFELNRNDIFYSSVSPTLTGVLMMVLLPSLMSGSTVILPYGNSPSSLVQMFEKHKVTVFYSVPYVYEMMSRSKLWSTLTRPAGLRLLLSSSASLSSQTHQNITDKLHLPIRSIYCSSEAGVIAYNRSTDTQKLLKSVGQPVEGVQLSIVDGNESMEVGMTGKILVSSPYCADEYQRNNTSVDCGDLGWLDHEGYLYLVGREKNTYNIAGYLVYPEEVESVLCSFSNVLDALVYVDHDTEWGTALTAQIVADGEVDFSELRKHCQTKLPKYKIPRKFEIVTSIKRNRSGKKVYPHTSRERSL